MLPPGPERNSSGVQKIRVYRANWLSERLSKHLLSGGAEEEVPGDDVVDLAGVHGAESPVEWKAQELALFVADEGHRLLEGIDRLDGAADDTLHGV